MAAGPVPGLAVGQQGTQHATLFAHLRGQVFHGIRAAIVDLGPGGLYQMREPGEPFLQAIEKTVLRMAGLDIQKPQDQGAAQAEQGGTEGRAHTRQGLAQAGLEVGEHRLEIAAAHLHTADHLAHGGDGAQQAPEGA